MNKSFNPNSNLISQADSIFDYINENAAFNLLVDQSVANQNSLFAGPPISQSIGPAGPLFMGSILPASVTPFSNNTALASTTIPPYTVVGASGGLQFFFYWDASVASNPNAAAFMAGVVQAANILESYIKTPAVVNLQVGWGELNGQPYTSGAVYSPSISNGSLCLILNNGIYYTVAQAQALGLATPTYGAGLYDGTIAFSTDAYVPWAYTDSSGVAAGYDDIIGSALHELTHALGREPAAVQWSNPGFSNLAPYVFHTPWYVGSVAYPILGFSIDGGKTFLNYFCPNGTEDPSDWLGSLGGGIPGYNFVDQANASMTNGAVVNNLTFSDLVEMSVLGYSVTASSVSMSTLYLSDVIDDIQVEKSLVSQITLSDSNAISISSTQLGADIAALSLINGAYTLAIADTSANIASNLAALQTNLAKITSITQSDVGTPLAITAAQLTADAGALAKIGGAYTLAVSGVTAASVATTVTNTHVTSLTVSDSAANINTSLASIITNLAKITSITQSGTATSIALTSAQYSSTLTTKFANFSATVTGVAIANVTTVLVDSKVTSLTITDTSAAIASNLDALQANLAKITSITQSGTAAALAITATQLTADAGALAKLGTYTLSVSGVAAANVATTIANTHVTSLTIADTGANLVTSLAALQTNLAKITSITQSDVGTPLAITAAQLTADAGALAKIGGAYTLAVSGVTAASVATTVTNTHVTSLTVSDSAANINTSLASIITNLAKITSITQSGTATSIALTSAQYSSTLTTKFANFSATVTGVAIANVTTVLVDSKVTSLTITDTSAAIASNLDALQANLAKITSITQSGTAAALAITATQLTADAGVLAKISGAYTLTVSDSSANVATYLNTLQTSIAKITSISLSDSNSMTITAAQSLADNSALAKISSAYNLTINGTTGVDTLKDTLNATSTMTGGTGIDTFIAVGHDTITDLGLGGADILQVAATGVVSAKLGAVWTATSSTSNLGQTIIDANGFNLSLALATTSTTGSHGYQIINTGSNGTGQALIGSALADTFTDGHNGDALSGGLGIDTFNITSGTITIRDLGAGGADVLNVSLGATVTANLAAAWTASSSTVNYGTTSIYGDFNVNVSAANTTAANSNGYTIWDNSGTSAVTEVGSGAADVLVAGHALDILTGGGGRDIFDIGASLGTSTTTATNYVKITDFVVGTSGDYLYSQDAFAAGHALHADVSNIASGWTLTNGFASKSGSTEATFYAMCKGLTFTADTAIGYTDGTNDYIYIMGEVSQANSSIVQLVGVHVTAISTVAAANSILIA